MKLPMLCVSTNLLCYVRFGKSRRNILICVCMCARVHVHWQPTVGPDVDGTFLRECGLLGAAVTRALQDFEC